LSYIIILVLGTNVNPISHRTIGKPHLNEDIFAKSTEEMPEADWWPDLEKQ
jgi:hypothetical protein